jgi:RimJ/RimL family protein N-acetyltransferase
MEFSIVPISEEHIRQFHAALGSVVRERRYLSFLQPPPLEGCAEFVRANIRAGVPQFVALVAGRVVGWCDVMPVAREACAHCGVLGIGIVEGFRGRGIGAALMRAAIDGAKKAGLTRVELTVRESNTSAIALYRKLGFEHEGVKRNAVRVDGDYENYIAMGLLLDRPPAKESSATLRAWQPPPRPARIALEGRYARLEPLDASRHGDDLFAASMAPGAEARFRYLFDVQQDRAAFQGWLTRVCASEDPLFYAVIDVSTGRCEGRQTLMRITPEHGVIEVGNILWGPAIARTRVATEALFLHAQYVFELGYRRFEWKCNAANEPSKRAAERFGFRYEGTFRQHMVVKGANRDTAWYAMLDHGWPALRSAFERWLAPENFDENGRQKSRLR